MTTDPWKLARFWPTKPRPAIAPRKAESRKPRQMTMRDESESSSEEVSRLQEMVYARPANPGPAAVLLETGRPEGEQSMAAKAVVFQAGE